MPCPVCNSNDGPYNTLNYCKTCHDKTISNITLRLGSIANNIVYWIQEVEKRYRSSIFYSEDLPLNFGPKRDSGSAEGFFENAKNFTIRPHIKPSDAIRKFIQGAETICECQGLLVAVMYNSLLDVLSVPVFDLVFRNLEITTSVRGPGGMIARLIDKVTTDDEGQVNRGDWVYLLNTKLSDRIQLALDGKASAAASGWNLVCVDSSQNLKLYMGLGLTDKKESILAFTLPEIKQKMVKDPNDNSSDNVVIDKDAVKKALLSGGKIDFGQNKPKPKALSLPQDIQLQGIYKIDSVKLLTRVGRALRPPNKI